MISVDRLSIYSTSTLVGGGEEEEQAHEEQSRRIAREQAQNASSEIDYCQFHPRVDFTDVADRIVGGITLSRQGSLSTLHASQPSQPLSTPPRPFGDWSRLAPLASSSAAQRITPLEASTSTLDNDLRVPWWSAIVPNPNLSRRKSSARMKVTKDRSNPPVTRNGSTSSPSSTPGTPPTNSSAPHSPNHTGSNSSPSSSPSQRSQSYSEDDFAPTPPPLPTDYSLYAKCYCEENAYLLAAYLSRVCLTWNEDTSIGNSPNIRWDVDVVVVSNKNQTVSLWMQKAGSSSESAYQVVWDYHVFVVVSCRKIAIPTNGRGRARESSTSGRARPQLFLRRMSDMARLDGETGERSTMSWVYDLDSRLANPTPLPVYLSATFGLDNDLHINVPKRFHPLFRVISASEYFTRFGSDRSHMKRATSPTRETFEWIEPRPEWDLILGCKATLSNSYFMDSFVDMRVRIGDGRYGVIVKLEELMAGQGLMADKEGHQEEALAAGVAVLLDRIPVEKVETVSTTIPIEQDEQERTPGVVIGGIVRFGFRPPPPPPDGAIIPLNRGKRVMDPLYPAYILQAYEHRAAEDEQVFA